MIDLDIDIKETMELLKLRMPQYVDRAAYSALGSVGFEVQSQVKAELTKKQRRAVLARKRVKGRRNPTSKKAAGLAWWKRFIRYRRFDQQHENISQGFGPQSGAHGQTVVIYPAKDDKRGTLEVGGGTFRNMRIRDSKVVQAIFQKFERGEITRVTPMMRKRLAAMGMPIRKTTAFLDYKARPVFKPAWRKMAGLIPSFFARKFFSNLNRYRAGVSVRDWQPTELVA